MSTVATQTVRDFAAEWAKLFKSAKLSGIVGDRAHAARGGYHISREDNPHGNYSIIRVDDQYGPSDAAAAVDMDLSSADMVLCTKRLVAAYRSSTDPRRKYLNGFNGWDGSGSATRFDFVAKKASTASADHKWHVHLEIRRRYLNQPSAMKAILSILAGESVGQFMGAIGVTPAPKSMATGKVLLTAPPWPGRVFKKDPNMKPSSDLKKWQARMIERGWKSIGAADGIFGDKTDAVVKSFQTACRLTPDGEIGARTWSMAWARPTGS